MINKSRQFQFVIKTHTSLNIIYRKKKKNVCIIDVNNNCNVYAFCVMDVRRDDFFSTFDKSLYYRYTSFKSKFSTYFLILQ